MKGDIPSLTLYYRESCHLCDDMLQHLREIQNERDFSLVRVDVDSHPELQRCYGSRIPVLVGDDQILCNYFLDPAALERYLTGFV